MLRLDNSNEEEIQMWGRKVETFKFPSLKLEMNISDLNPSRQLDMNGGVEIEVIGGQTKKTLFIRCDAGYRGNIQKMDQSYKRNYISQGVQINTLNELLDMIQNQGTPEEKAILPTMLASINAACLKALSWLGNKQESKDELNAYQFIGVGKRMNVETYDLDVPIKQLGISLTPQ